MVKNCKSQLAKWYEEEAIKAYDKDQTAKGDIIMLMADSRRAYERLMNRHDWLITRAIHLDDEEQRNALYSLAEKAKAQALQMEVTR